jgi:hypothetical protein
MPMSWIWCNAIELSVPVQHRGPTGKFTQMSSWQEVHAFSQPLDGTLLLERPS